MRRKKSSHLLPRVTGEPNPSFEPDQPYLPVLGMWRSPSFKTAPVSVFIMG